jgi:DNA mismatch endonuclease (patch repair protein)
MSRIGSADTKPEMLVRKFLFSKGFRFRLHSKNLPGKPDIVLKKYRAVIFVNGCFWHNHVGCRYAKIPDSNRDYWLPKLQRNKERDEEERNALLALGWRVLIVWECAIKTKASREKALPEVESWLRGSDPVGEIAG